MTELREMAKVLGWMLLIYLAVEIPLGIALFLWLRKPKEKKNG